MHVHVDGWQSHPIPTSARNETTKVEKFGANLLIFSVSDQVFSLSVIYLLLFGNL